LKISVNKTETIAVKGKNVRTKILKNNHIIEQVNSFNYLGYAVTVTNNRDLEIKMNTFSQMCCTTRTTQQQDKKRYMGNLDYNKKTGSKKLKLER
jgi:hypothetical protein